MTEKDVINSLFSIDIFQTDQEFQTCRRRVCARFGKILCLVFLRTAFGKISHTRMVKNIVFIHHPFINMRIELKRAVFHYINFTDFTIDKGIHKMHGLMIDN